MQKSRLNQGRLKIDVNNPYNIRHFEIFLFRWMKTDFNLDKVKWEFPLVKLATFHLQNDLISLMLEIYV